MKNKMKNKMKNTTTINDRPIIPNGTQKNMDLLGVNLYQEALVEFIDKSTTPMTIAIQGEWGSGKSSLMYYLKEALCNVGDFEGIWINSWEYALFNDDIGALLHIVGDITESLIGEQENKEINPNIKIVKDYLLKITKTAMVVAGRDYRFIDEMTEDKAKKSDSYNSTITVAEIRSKLEEIIDLRLQSNKQKKGLILFIDDLDRIEPTIAVRILEILKNIFDINNCIFIIAIDYDVVVKGLEPKYGEMTDKNEREFRSFFDKIIQVPYAIPVSDYKIDDFLTESLQSIDYFGNTKSNEDKIKDLSDYARLSVGTNPRSIKRLINLLSLIKIINDIKNKENNEKFNDDDQVMLFAVVCIQLAYPKIYEILKKEVMISRWNSALISQKNIQWPLENEIKDIEKIVNNKKEVDKSEDWVIVLYVLCKNDPYLVSNFLDIKEILEKLSEDVSRMKNNNEDEIEKYLASMVYLTSVTAVSKKDNNKDERPRIGKQVKIFFEKNISGKNINPKLIEKFMSLKYSKDNLKLTYPLLADKREGDLRKRYWKDAIQINDKDYYICSQWFAYNQDCFDLWKESITEELIS